MGDRLVQAFRISTCSILLRALPTFLGSYSTENAYGMIKKNTILFGSPMILLFVSISTILSRIHIFENHICYTERKKKDYERVRRWLDYQVTGNRERGF